MNNIDNNKKITKVKLSKKFVKGIDDDLILPTVNWDDFLEDNWCYIYPNGGTAENPANIVPNSRYINENPFPGYIVECVTEIQFNGNWGYAGFGSDPGYAADGYGADSHQLNNNQIITQTGANHIVLRSNMTGSPLGVVTEYNSAPCRVKVYKIGKIKR